MCVCVCVCVMTSPFANRPSIRKSWDKGETDIIGRFDMLFDGNNRLKLLEYNADTPTVLVESGVAQENWLALKNFDKTLSGVWDKPPVAGLPTQSQHNNTKLVQFNRIEEMLVNVWKRWHARAEYFDPDVDGKDAATTAGSTRPDIHAGSDNVGQQDKNSQKKPHLYFAYPEDPEDNEHAVEEYETVMFLMKTAVEAGLRTEACMKPVFFCFFSLFSRALSFFFFFSFFLFSFLNVEAPRKGIIAL